MSKIRIKNFGPIKEGFTENGGWMDIKKVTLFIGNQGSGKSTVAKLITTFMWMEKTLNRGDIANVTCDDFKGDYCSYHRMFDYFQAGTEIFFQGDCYTFKYFDDTFELHPIDISEQVLVPKIMYVPAERNFLSTVKNADEVKGLPRPLFTFQDEFERSMDELKGILDLPIGGLKFEYDRLLKISYILGEGYKIKLLDASSGLHSLVPLFLVIRNLAMGVANKEQDPSKSALSIRQEQRKRAQIRELKNDLVVGELSEEREEEYRKKIELIESKYINSKFINIVEEPEQNLFPTSQKALLDSLVGFNNTTAGNKLIMTTHSPYIINYLTLSVEAFGLLKKIEQAGEVDTFSPMVSAIVPLNATVDPDDLAIYELDEKDGSIQLLTGYNGLPSDDNKLNFELGQGNDLFIALLEIEDKLKNGKVQKNEPIAKH